MADPAPIDCDLHPTVPAMAALLPYLDDHLARHRGPARHRRPEHDLLPVRQPAHRARRLAGRPGASRRRRWSGWATEALDPFGTQLAICNCLYGVQAQFSEDLGAALARAVNDWIAREWLDRDPRLRASIVVPHAERRAGGRRDRTLRRRPALRPGACCWWPENCRWGGGRTGRSTPRPSGTGCRWASMPAAVPPPDDRRSAGRALTARTTSTRRGASSPS